MRGRLRIAWAALLIGCDGGASGSAPGCPAAGMCGSSAAGAGGRLTDGGVGGGAGRNTGGGVGGSAGGGVGGSVSGGRAGGTGGASGGNANGGRAGGTGGASGGSANGGRAGGTGAVPGSDGGTPDGGGCPAQSGAAYDDVVLCDEPVAYWAMSQAGTELDLSGNGHDGAYQGGAAARASLPNGDSAADFNGSSQYLTVPSSSTFSISTTGSLTWEAWIRPDVLQFPGASSDGYVDWMGKCASYSPTCEWEARMYATTTAEMRCNRLSAYVFNPTAGLGSGADWQPVCGLIQANQWLYVVGEYTTSPDATPPGCASSNPTQYPGAIDIWLNGVKWNQSRHGDTGCLGQYKITPRANNSPLNIGTMAKDTWFKGAIGKVAIYGRLLTQAQIINHYQVMAGRAPTGSCADTCSF